MQSSNIEPGKTGTEDDRSGSTEQMQENRQGQQDASNTDNPVEGRNVNVQNKPGPEVDENRKNRDANRSQKSQSSSDPRQNL